MNDYLTAQKVAEELGLHHATVLTMFREGTLPAVKLGKSWFITREALNDALTKREASRRRHPMNYDPTGAQGA